jgi:hypothetical protein
MMTHNINAQVPEDPPPGGRTVAGVFDTRQAAEAAIAALREHRVADDRIGLVHSGEGAAPNIPAGDTKAEAGFATGAAVGGAVGGAAGLAIGLTSLAIPGIGPLLAAGPLLTALAGAATGAGMGGLVGSFAGMGIPEQEAKEYEHEVRRGGFFVSVSTEDADEADRLCQLLSQHGARAVQSYDPKL